MTIKRFVENKWAEGERDPWKIYRAVQEHFPHKCAGWDYVLGLVRIQRRK